MGFLDVAFLPTQASISTTSLNDRGRGDPRSRVTCLRTVVGVRHGMILVLC